MLHPADSFVDYSVIGSQGVNLSTYACTCEPAAENQNYDARGKHSVDGVHLCNLKQPGSRFLVPQDYRRVLETILRTISSALRTTWVQRTLEAAPPYPDEEQALPPRQELELRERERSILQAILLNMASLGEDLLGVVNKLQDLVFNTIGNDSLDLPQIV